MWNRSCRNVHDAAKVVEMTLEEVPTNTFTGIIVRGMFVASRGTHNAVLIRPSPTTETYAVFSISVAESHRIWLMDPSFNKAGVMGKWHFDSKGHLHLETLYTRLEDYLKASEATCPDWLWPSL